MIETKINQSTQQNTAVRSKITPLILEFVCFGLSNVQISLLFNLHLQVHYLVIEEVSFSLGYHLLLFILCLNPHYLW